MPQLWWKLALAVWSWQCACCTDEEPRLAGMGGLQSGLTCGCAQPLCPETAQSVPPAAAAHPVLGPLERGRAGVVSEPDCVGESLHV